MILSANFQPYFISAIKLVDNMGDLEYVRRARACDALGTAWTALQSAGQGDKVRPVLFLRVSRR